MLRTSKASTAVPAGEKAFIFAGKYMEKKTPVYYINNTTVII
jgi:hypothetical protein